MWATSDEKSEAKGDENATRLGLKLNVNVHHKCGLRRPAIDSGTKNSDRQQPVTWLPVNAVLLILISLSIWLLRSKIHRKEFRRKARGTARCVEMPIFILWNIVN